MADTESEVVLDRDFLENGNWGPELGEQGHYLNFESEEFHLLHSDPSRSRIDGTYRLWSSGKQITLRIARTGDLQEATRPLPNHCELLIDYVSVRYPYYLFCNPGGWRFWDRNSVFEAGTVRELQQVKVFTWGNKPGRLPQATFLHPDPALQKEHIPYCIQRGADLECADKAPLGTAITIVARTVRPVRVDGVLQFTYLVEIELSRHAEDCDCIRTESKLVWIPTLDMQ
ncbi:MAG: hypothetical protein KDK34_13510 [Leptospiraceae bacterium]|nr:hypothetical protein [Leptospiraceae bacterium]